MEGRGMTSAERLIAALRNHRAAGLPRHFVTVAPTVDRRPPMRDFDAALAELRHSGYQIRERRRRRTGQAVYQLEAEIPSLFPGPADD